MNEEEARIKRELGFIVVCGSPMDGLYFHGPFESHESAETYGASNDMGDTWWVAPLEQPT